MFSIQKRAESQQNVRCLCHATAGLDMVLGNTNLDAVNRYITSLASRSGRSSVHTCISTCRQQQAR